MFNCGDSMYFLFSLLNGQIMPLMMGYVFLILGKESHFTQTQQWKICSSRGQG